MTRLKYCSVSGKVRYPTYWRARRVQMVMNAKYHHRRNSGSVYRCCHCHDWHLTHYKDCICQEEMIYVRDLLSKKQKRSQRNATKRMAQLLAGRAKG